MATMANVLKYTKVYPVKFDVNKLHHYIESVKYLKNDVVVKANDISYGSALHNCLKNESTHPTQLPTCDYTKYIYCILSKSIRVENFTYVGFILLREDVVIR